PLTVLSELIPRFMLSLMHPVIRKTSATNAPIRPAVRARRDILEPPVVGIPGRLPRPYGWGEQITRRVRRPRALRDRRGSGTARRRARPRDRRRSRRPTPPR